MSTNTEDISKSLRVAGMYPLDPKTVVPLLSDIIDLGSGSSKAYTYYDGLEVFCLENRKKYIWKEIALGDTGLIPGGFAYPPDVIVDGVDYSGRIFNFVLSEDSFSIGNLVYLEPSVNIEYKEDQIATQAMYFGTYDDGGGLEDVAFVKNSFVSQSNFAFLNGINVGAEIKMANASNGKYLGHFVISDVTVSGYRSLTVIEKGDWVPIGDYLTQQVLISVVKESPYTLTITGTVLTLKKGNTIIGNPDIGPLLPAGSSVPTGGVFNPGDNTITITLADTSTFDIDFSGAITALTQLDKNSSVAVASSALYENFTILRNSLWKKTGALYTADLTTNYNSTSFPGFPYPGPQFDIVMKYNNVLYWLTYKTGVQKEYFREPNLVLRLSYYKRVGNVQTKLAYFSVLTKPVVLDGLNTNYIAYKVWGLNQLFPGDTTTGSFDETAIPEGIFDINGVCFVNLISIWPGALNKRITLPYTLQEIDHGLDLVCYGAGDIAVPSLKNGFRCKITKAAASPATLNLVPDSGITLENVKLDVVPSITGKNSYAYIRDATENNGSDVTMPSTTRYFVEGTLD